MSVWVISRAAGVGALWLFAASAVLGHAARMAVRARPGWVHPLHYLHTALAVAGWTGALVHVLLLRHDPTIPFTWKALLVPLAAPYRPFWTGLGTLALYGWGLTLVAFDAKKRVGMNVFRLLHDMAPAALGLAALHALGAGSDVRLTSLRLAAGALLALALLIAAERLLGRRPPGSAGEVSAAGRRQGL
ncbi:MAG: hypothetical protein AB1609_02000 [Bacillota bacterium]